MQPTGLRRRERHDTAGHDLGHILARRQCPALAAGCVQEVVVVVIVIISTSFGWVDGGERGLGEAARIDSPCRLKGSTPQSIVSALKR